MNKSDYQQFQEEMRRTADAYNTEMTPGRVKTYFDDLADLSLDAVIGGFQYARKTSTFFPKIAEIRKYAEGSLDDRAELAWRTFVELVKSEAAYPSLQVFDGAMAYAIECLGGWLTACAKLNEASVEMAANYEKGFKASYKLGEMRSEPPRYLVGQHEVNNRSLGAWKSPTVGLKVCLVKPGSIVPATMPFDIAQGRLTDDARKALQAGTGPQLAKYLPPRLEPLKSLPPVADDEEMATPEEVEELLARMKQIAPSSRNGLALVKPTNNNGGTKCK